MTIGLRLPNDSQIKDDLKLSGDFWRAGLSGRSTALLSGEAVVKPVTSAYLTYRVLRFWRRFAPWSSRAAFRQARLPQ